MFYSKAANNLINEIYKRSLCVAFIKCSSWTIHGSNIPTLVIEIYKSLNHINPPIMPKFFNLKVDSYSFRNNSLQKLPKTNNSQYRMQGLCFK